ncbi:MAG: CapA family protein [Burkholderiales bacterium]|nr:MAG: CapA family protein [Burkholderiales bacterium]
MSGPRDAARAQPAPPRADRQPADEVMLFLGGDVMTGRGIDQALAHPSSPELYEPWVRDAREYLRLAERANGPIAGPVPDNYVWGDALAELDRMRPDLRIVNLETAVTVADRPFPGKGIHYRMHPANVACLTAAGLDCCVLANNHVMDWGRDGLAETLAMLRQAGLHTAGAGEDADAAFAPAVLPLPGGARLLLFAFATESSGVPSAWSATDRRPGVALLPELGAASAEFAAERIAAQRRSGEPVVVSIHWGGNWGCQVPETHRAFAHRLVDLGAADLVHGHSSHHPLPAEVYRDRLILYGCGDLINDYEGIGEHDGLRSDMGCLYFAALERSTGKLRSLRIVPLQLRRLRLAQPEPEALRWLEQLLTLGGRALGSGLSQHPMGGWRLEWE